MRVLLVNHTSIVSGAELSLLGLLEELEGDVECVLACPEGDLAESARRRGVPVAVIPAIEGSFKLDPMLAGRLARELAGAARALARVTDTVAPDLVHAYSVRAGLTAALASRRAPPALIVHVHDVLPDNRAAAAIARVIGARAVLTLTNSDHTARRLRERGFGAPLRTVHEGVDLCRFDRAAVDRDEARARLGVGPEEIALGVVAQITPWKGQDAAIEALARLRRTHPRARLLLVGEAKFVSRATRFDNRAYLAQLHRLVAGLGLHDAVEFVGQRTDLPTVFRALDVALAPSWEEPFGRMVIEAMSMGTPVIATEAGGPREVITHGVDGLLVPPKSPERLADALAELLDDDARRANLAERGWHTARRFSRSAHARAVVAAYHDVGAGASQRADPPAEDAAGTAEHVPPAVPSWPSPPVTIVAHDVGGMGGMERQLEKLINGVLAAGGDVTVISRTCRLPERENLRWIRVPGPNRPFSVAFAWFYLAASFIAAFRRRGLLHSTGALIANRVDVATVHFCHLGMRRRLGRYRRSSRNTVLYAVNSWVVRILSEAAERWSYRPARVRRLVAVSDGVLSELRECFPRVGDRVLVIPNGVDLDDFRPDAGWRAGKRAELGLGDDALAAIFIGGDWSRKGLACAVEAVGRRPRWHLIVAGAGDAEPHRASAEAAGAADRVHFLDAVGDVNRYLAASDAFVFPTAYEAAPLVGYEAAASGVPLLVTRVNGVKDFLQDGVSGWFIERNADCIERRLADLEADPELRARMARAAREAVERFDWDSVVARYGDLYHSLGRDVS